MLRANSLQRSRPSKRTDAVYNSLYDELSVSRSNGPVEHCSRWSFATDRRRRPYGTQTGPVSSSLSQVSISNRPVDSQFVDGAFPALLPGTNDRLTVSQFCECAAYVKVLHMRKFRDAHQLIFCRVEFAAAAAHTRRRDRNRFRICC
jgi:hypothetical protein